MNEETLRAEDLPLRTLDPDSPVPLYHQIEEDLRQLIQSGELKPEQPLPPELELASAYGVGRHTIRMAMGRLVADDLIARQAGRGTFVQSLGKRKKFYLDRSFTRQMAELGKSARSRVLDMSLDQVKDIAPEPLQGQAGEPCLHLFRLRFGDDEPIGLQSTTVLTRRCPGLEEYDFEQESLYDVLASEYRLNIGRIEHNISAAVADEFQAGLLKIRPSDPLLVVNTTAFVEDDKMIEYSTSYYRADRYEYRTTHTYRSA